MFNIFQKIQQRFYKTYSTLTTDDTVCYTIDTTQIPINGFKLWTHKDARKMLKQKGYITGFRSRSMARKHFKSNNIEKFTVN